MTICENENYRWLDIANTIQTVMDIHQPHKLVLPHLHGMLLSLYFNPNPQKVLELGLGGGAIQRFFGHYFPATQCHSVELDKQIIDYFLQYFSGNLSLPSSTPNPLTLSSEHITHGDARKVIKHHRHADLLFIDLFSGNAPPKFINDPQFYQDCLTSLSEDGLMIINLLPLGEVQTLIVEEILTKLTGFPPAIFSIPQYKNRIIMSGRFSLGHLPFNTKLQTVAKQYQLDLMNVIQLK